MGSFNVGSQHSAHHRRGLRLPELVRDWGIAAGLGQTSVPSYSLVEFIRAMSLVSLPTPRDRGGDGRVEVPLDLFFRISDSDLTFSVNPHSRSRWVSSLGWKAVRQLNVTFFYPPNFDTCFIPNSYFPSCCHGLGTGGNLQACCRVLCGRLQWGAGPRNCVDEQEWAGWVHLIWGNNQWWVDGQSGNDSSPIRRAFLSRVFLFLVGPLSSAFATFLTLLCFQFSRFTLSDGLALSGFKEKKPRRESSGHQLWIWFLPMSQYPVPLSRKFIHMPVLASWAPIGQPWGWQVTKDEREIPGSQGSVFHQSLAILCCAVCCSLMGLQSSLLWI